MEFRPIMFSELDAADKTTIESWAPLIPAQFHCKVGTYAKCEEVGDCDRGLYGIEYSLPIGFVLSGKLEICESYEFLGMTAYRPIRILSQGDLIGDFSFLDANLGCDGTSDRGESWRIHAGARSVLIAQKISRIDEHFITEGGTTRPHLILPWIIQEGARVLFFDGALLQKGNADLVDRLLRHSWVKAKIYRDCLNSFNFNKLLLFKEKAYRAHEALITSTTSDGGREYTQAVSKDAILDVFLDAVWDACNRPLRHEPLFERAMISSEASQLGVTGVKAQNIYLASTSWKSKNPLLFPVGSHNFLIAAYARAASENPAKLRRDRIRTNIDNVFHKQNSQKPAKKKPANQFYLDIANTLIASEIVPQYPDFPYGVECKEIQGTHSKMMVLEFTRRDNL